MTDQNDINITHQVLNGIQKYRCYHHIANVSKEQKVLYFSLICYFKLNKLNNKLSYNLTIKTLFVIYFEEVISNFNSLNFNKQFSSEVFALFCYSVTVMQEGKSSSYSSYCPCHMTLATVFVDSLLFCITNYFLKFSSCQAAQHIFSMFSPYPFPP